MAALVLIQFFFLPEVTIQETASLNISSEIPDLYIEESSIPSDIDWSIFKAKTVAKPIDSTPIDELYILRGTFIVNQSNNNISRKAIIDDLKNNTQLIVVERQTLDDGRQIVEIKDDQVIILNGSAQEILILPFSIISSIVENAPQSQNISADSLTGKFGGKKTGENQWAFEKDKIMKYYDELMADPKRLLNLFDSFAPVYSENKKITGYKIDIKGEKEFINAVGLKDGDYITKVNALRLTNRRRAEYMIGEFIEGRASSFALEVEREDDSQKMIYRTH
jgi:type II secretory pathway component PulC